MAYKDPDYHKKYNETHKEQAKVYMEKYRKENREKILITMRDYYHKNKEKITVKHKEYCQTHKEQINKYERERRRNNPQYKLSRNISCSIYQSLKSGKNGKHWETILDYALDDLIKRLKKTIPKGFTWQDYLNGELHIDHKIPIYAFNFDSYDDLDFHRCFALENLQLLEATENMKKNKKIKKSFQPCLKI